MHNELAALRWILFASECTHSGRAKKYSAKTETKEGKFLVVAKKILRKTAVSGCACRFSGRGGSALDVRCGRLPAGKPSHTVMASASDLSCSQYLNNYIYEKN